ncbi:mitochondrial 39-S ribosomal protein L47 (MRP-L47)-domain-containing protein [Gymnopilus junonius]|uniref:Large ribosomal subunit protein uL29m n=1 Tax=Gymnopilus junonius TaxID=109634 RepID=A0A9P5NRU6_GYMJU|nr:mitochondrial 39-S ribosomal protein L47 (MRP-L47)-domain-containing protein [Gymnopilus junonius]
MLSLYRNASKQGLRPSTRSLAQVVQKQTSGPSIAKKVPVRDDHGLYGFFRKKPAAGLVGEARYEVVETPEEGQLVTGRAWEATELRNKSFKDLHTLWYVALREKNLLATQREEARRMGVTHPDLQVSKEKVRHCQKTMARIKLVLNERRLAFEGAMKIAESEQAAAKDEENYDEEDRQVLDFQFEQAYTRQRPTQGRWRPGQFSR